MSVFWDETIFTFPFSYDGGLEKWKGHLKKRQLEVYWEKSKDIDSKYFLKHVYNEENKPYHYEYKNGSLNWRYGEEITVKTSLTGDDVEAEYGIFLIGFSLFVFPTGVGFLTMRIRYHDNETISNIINFSAAFSRVCANEKGIANGNINCCMGGKNCSLTHLIRDSVGKYDGDAICFFPCTNSKRAFVFHRLLRSSMTESEKLTLRRNLWINDTHEQVTLTELEQEIELGDGRLCMISPTTMCIITSEKKGSEKEQIRKQNNIRFSYFNLFLFCVHEQQGLLLYNQRKVAIGKKIGHAKKIKNDLLRFLPTYSFKVVSTEITYQQIFLSLQKILNLQALEESLKENIYMLETEYKQRQDKGLNVFLTILSALGGISVIVDIFTLLSYFD